MPGPYKYWSEGRNPTTTDDRREGFAVGSLWSNTATDVLYVCSDSTANAAVWDAISGGGTPIPLTVKEVDGTPSVNTTTIRFPNGTITDDGSGQVTMAIPESSVTNLSTDLGTLNGVPNIGKLGTNRINLFNPSDCVDGVLVGYLDGVQSAYADGMESGYVPVEPGKTYFISRSAAAMGTVISCFDAAKNFLGNDHAISAYPVAVGITTLLNQHWVTWESTVTIAPTSYIAYIRFQLIYTYAAHTTADFDTVRNSIMFEVAAGSHATPTFQAYVPASTEILDTALPKMVRGGVTVVRSGSKIYTRTPWTSTTDLVNRFDLQTAILAYDNRCVEMDGIYTIPISTLDANVPSTSLTVLKDCSDDITPLNIWITYIGANHGAFYMQTITMTAHGKTVVDVGSHWQDGSSNSWYIMRVVDANTLWVMPANTGAGSAWAFLTSISGSSLTHVAGATHTGTITFTSPTLTQLLPAVKTHVKQALTNGKAAINFNGVHVCDWLDIVHTYDISDVPSLLAYVISQVGSSTQPAFDNSSIDNCARITITYRVSSNGSVTIFQTIEALKDISVATGGYMGYIQAGPITPPGGGSLMEYIPGMSPQTIGGHSYDGAAIQDITSILDVWTLPTAAWMDANNPPARFVQFSKTSGGTPSFGIAIGYNTQVGIGKPAIRKTLINSAGTIYTSKKQYPQAVSAGSSAYGTNIIPAGTVLDCVAFRCPINYTSYPLLTNVSWYWVGNDCYLMIDGHSAYSGYVALASDMLYKRIEEIEVSANCTVNSTMTTIDGIRITLTGYGYCVLRLY